MKTTEERLSEYHHAHTPDKYFGCRKIEGVPKHVAIICDGNRRWAKEHDLSIKEGHIAGADNIMRLLETSGELGIETLTVWVMDTKNFKKRSKEEIKNLLKIFLYYAMTFKREFISEDIRFRHMGAREFLPKKVQKLIRELEAETAHKTQATLNVAFNYDGQDDIVRAVRRMIRDGLSEDEINISNLTEYLDTGDTGYADMIIRTGKEHRLSGFMSWQSAPAELFFPNFLFPDYTPDEFEKSVIEFTQRNRRFGA